MARKSDDRPRGGDRPLTRPFIRKDKGAPVRVGAERTPPQHASAERIAKVMARAGLCSRREAEEWIAAGRVSVNGAAIASPAVNVADNDRIEVDGKPLPERERTRLFLYHKPVGLVTSHDDPQGRPTIFASLPKNLPRLLSVGRLDIGTEGLLLLTNDGGLARVLELPDTGWLRRYRVRAHGRVTQDELDKLRTGITIEGIHYGPVEATLDRAQGANVWLTFAIREGKNREVRNVLGHLGLQVNRLIRVSFGPFQLGELAEGAVEEIKTRHLREQLGERITEQAGCDFAGPVIQRQAEEPPRPQARAERTPRGEDRDHQRTPRERPEGRRDEQRPQGRERPGRRDERRPFGKRKRELERLPEKPPGRPRRGHAWRKDDAPLRRHYRGGRAEPPRERPETAGDKRPGLLTDRKGRRVLVERFGSATADKPKAQERPARPAGRPQKPGGKPHTGRPHRFDGNPPRPGGKPPRQGKAGRRDRASGPRPARPPKR